MRVSRTFLPLLCLVLAVPVFAASNSKSDNSAATISLDGFPSLSANSYSFGVSIALSESSGGAGAGKATFSDFSFTKKMDASSSSLFKACATGTHIKNVIIVVRDDKGNTLNQIMLSDVIIHSIQASGDGTNPVESISLSYAKVEFKF